MHVTDAPVMTNHCLWERRESSWTDESYKRLERVGDLHPTTAEDALDAVRQAAYPDYTLWSVVYDRAHQRGTWYARCRWDRPIGLMME